MQPSTKPQHTPGPWKHDVYGHIIAMVPTDGIDIGNGKKVTFEGASYEQSQLICTYQGNPNAVADSRLIAAAPELLEALRDIHWRLDEHVNGISALDLSDLPSRVEKIRQAIAKATGEQ